MDLEKLANRIIDTAFHLLFFLVPLIMTPWNFELFEFNKILIVYALTTIIVAAWLAKMVISQKLIFRRTPLDVPLILFLIFNFLSFIFSIDRHTSFWGYYGRFNGGLLSTISYITLYYAFVSNFYQLSAKSYQLKAALASGFLVSAYGILEHFGIDAKYWVQDVKTRVFSTLGQPNWLAAYLAILIPVAMAFALMAKSKIQNFIFCFLFFVFYFCLLYTKSRSGFAGFWVANIIFIILIISINRDRLLLKKLLGVSLIFLCLTLLVGSPFEQLNRFLPYQLSTRNAQPATSQPSDSEGGTESGEIRKIVWKGALDIARHYPLFGSGVETFAYSYYQFRPKEHNLVSEWDFLYNKAHNEYLNYAATTGFVGLGTYLLFVVAFVWWFIRMYPNLDNPNKSEYIILALFSGWLSILITNFFGFSVVPVALYFYLIPAVCFAISSPFTQGVNSRQPLRLPSDTASSAGRSNNVQKLLIFLIVISTFYILNFAFRYWRADTFYAKAYQLAKTGGYKDAYDNYHRAINFLPSEPLYRSDLSYTTAVLAVLAFGQNEATLAGQLAEEAILQDAVALNTSPANLNFWKTRTRTYSTLGILDPRFKQKAIEALLGAKKLAPTDAKIVYNLGLLYDQVGESEKAIETLKETVTLKSNYRDAYYALAIMYHESGKNQEAIAQLELILKQFSPDDQMIKDKIKEWKTENKKITE